MFTARAGDGERFARSAVSAGADLVVAIGGDGTLHEVVNGVLGSKCAVGLIPFGTGNDVARAVGLHGDLDRACQAITNGTTTPMDVGVVTAEGLDGERHFLVLTGAGFISRTAERVNKGIRWISGAGAYVVGAILTLRDFRPFNAVVTIDDNEPIRTHAMFVCAANTSNTGGGMELAPGADYADGLLDICIVSRVSKPELLYELGRVFKGEHVKNPAVKMLRGRKVRFDADPPQPLLIDGEVIGQTPIAVSILPGGLTLCVPAK